MFRLSITPYSLSPARTSVLSALVCSALVVGCKDSGEPSAAQIMEPPTNPVYTAGSGSSSVLLGRANFSDPADPVLKVKRMSGDWHMELKSKPGFDLAVQSITFQPNGHSGWHSHPGPVFIQVVSGTMTFYESGDPNCTPTVRTAGQGYLDYGDHAHIARNESAAAAVNVVTYFAPAGVPLRVDQPNPGNCPF